MDHSTDIYEPAEDSELLAQIVAKKAHGRVLDMGTGSGIQAITASKLPDVRGVLAVDINPNAVKHVSEEAKTQNLQRFKTIQSDLFENVSGQFETIIFNAPYLPQDYIAGKAIIDPALYGGKHGFEIIVRFLESVGSHLARGGKILLLFSSLTRKDVVDETIAKNLFSFQEVASEKLPMLETLYVYEISATPIRESLISLGVKDIMYHAKGARGVVYKGKWDVNSQEKKFLASKNDKKVAIKLKLDSSSAPGTLELEARALKEVNKKRIGPKLYYSHSDFLIMEFIEGISFDKFIEKHGKESLVVKIAVRKLLEDAYHLDKLGLNKEEMHRPYSNVLVSETNGKVDVTLLDTEKSKISGIHKTPRVVLLDFERCRNSETPQNVTQLVSFLIKFKFIPKEKGIKLAEEYKGNYSLEVFEKILGLLKVKSRNV